MWKSGTCVLLNVPFSGEKERMLNWVMLDLELTEEKGKWLMNPGKTYDTEMGGGEQGVRGGEWVVDKTSPEARNLWGFGRLPTDWKLQMSCLEKNFYPMAKKGTSSIDRVLAWHAWNPVWFPTPINWVWWFEWEWSPSYILMFAYLLPRPVGGTNWEELGDVLPDVVFEVSKAHLIPSCVSRCKLFATAPVPVLPASCDAPCHGSYGHVLWHFKPQIKHFLL